MHISATAQKSPVDQKLQAKLAALRGKTHLPAELLELVTLVTRLQNEYLPKVVFNSGRKSLPAETADKRSPGDQRYAGLPILPGREFPLDLPLVEELARELLATLPEAIPLLADHAHDLAAKWDAKPDLLEAACREILDPSLYGQGLPHLDAWAEEHPEAPHFFHFVVMSAAMPSLVVVGRLLGEEHDKEKVWTHGHCPVCGNQPLMGRLVDKEGRRLHSCSFCGFEYRAPRMGCPFCLTSEDEGAEYHVSEDETGYLLTVCKSCNNYFKLGDFREYDRPWFPLLDDLSSITLDLYARKMDYSRPTLSGWGF